MPDLAWRLYLSRTSGNSSVTTCTLSRQAHAHAFILIFPNTRSPLPSLSMKLIDALRVTNAARGLSGDSCRVDLACGFMPLHLATFLTAHLQQRSSDRRVALRLGQYGDLVGNLERAANCQPGDGPAELLAVVVEWSDLDPRLGWRSLGGWDASARSDILHSVSRALQRLSAQIASAAKSGIVVGLVSPTLDLPPVALTSGATTSEFEAAIRQMLSGVLVTLSGERNVRIVNEQRLAHRSPPSVREDTAALFASGFPYSLTHADALSALVAEVLIPSTRKKGLITDLDDTMWRGILGDVGVEGISNSLDGGGQRHGIYQVMLASLAEAGVLLAIASKNEPDIVTTALNRPSQIARESLFFPVEANWQPKSGSVAKILQTWNVAADSVVFVDDSPMEVAEVQAMHPNVQCFLFPKDDPKAITVLLSTLRDLFGKDSLQAEDQFRLASIRNASRPAMLTEESLETQDEFLGSAHAEIVIRFSKDYRDARALELVNKTNQFNLNGERYSEIEWHNALKNGPYELVTVSYQDKFGPLGKIAVLLVKRDDSALSVHAWVLSCRAFSRRIEHQILSTLFQRFGVADIYLRYKSTERNAPLGAFLESFVVGAPLASPVRISRAVFDSVTPKLTHRVTTNDTGDAQ